ncbi:toxin-antitoxin system YwqK family antitoxin [Dyella sp. C11]|uniref:toxin-antitoxin system YwqK family antitoxin n=1 Tax=Dyella sp. C11 TaxID=2126991 RepID=UPI000D64EB7B|nr:toxin-antitoxin system YwqK family antitoxin [Dyella sp. C11]
MKDYRIAALAACLALTACGGEEVDQRQTETVQGLVYKLHDSEPFTGTVTHSKISLYDTFQVGECNISYKKGVIDGKAECFSNDGRKVTETHFSNEKKDGSETRWNLSGKTTYEASWKDGKKDGHERIYDDSGALIHELTWSNGVQDGAEKEWDTTGKVVLKDFNWSNGKPTGHQEAASNNGRVTMTLKNGLLNGVRKEFSPDGQLHDEQNFVDGIADGNQHYVDNNADWKRVWSRGLLKSATVEVRDEKGQLVESDQIECTDRCGWQVDGYVNAFQFDWTKAKVLMIEFNPLSTRRSPLDPLETGFRKFDWDAGVLLGTMTGKFGWSFDHRGIAKFETTFVSGIPTGTQKAWDDQGQLIIEATRDNGKLAGATGSLWPIGGNLAAPEGSSPPGSLQAPPANTDGATRAGNPSPTQIVIFQFQGSNGPEPAFCADEGQDGVMCRSDSVAEIGAGTYRDFMIKGSATCIAGSPGCVVPKVFAAVHPRG